MATCRTPGCDNEALPETRGRYANLCAQHKQERYDALHNGSADARAAGETAAAAIMGPSGELSILDLAIQLDSAYDQIEDARDRYRGLLEQLQRRVEGALPQR